MEVDMYDTALDTLKLLKDRERVRNLINSIPINKHYEFRKKIDQMLSNSVSIGIGVWCVCVCVMNAIPPANQVEMTTSPIDPHCSFELPRLVLCLLDLFYCALH